MENTNLEVGKLAKHIYFDYPELFIVKILESGNIGCRYRSFHRNANSTSDYVLHYAEFEPFELIPYKPEENKASLYF